MKTGTILLAIAILFSSLQPARSQLGNILNKAKEATKSAASKTKETSSNEPAKQQAPSKIVKTEIGNPKDIDPVIGVSISKLQKSYGTIDLGVYLNAGEKEPMYFYNGSALSEPYLQQLRTLLSYMYPSGNTTYPFLFKYENSGDRVLPAENMIHIMFAAYRGAPKELYAMLLEGRAVLKGMADGSIYSDFRNTNTILAKLERENDALIMVYNFDVDNKYLSLGYGYHEVIVKNSLNNVRTLEERITNWKNEEARLMALYRENVTFSSVKEFLVGWLNSIKVLHQNGHVPIAAYLSYQIDIAADDFKNHPKKKVENEEYHKILSTYEDLSKNSFPSWRKETNEKWIEVCNHLKKEMKIEDNDVLPKAAISNPKLEAEMIAIAKTIYDDGRVPVKAIIKNPDWGYDRDGFGKIIDRFQTAYIIFKMTDGTHKMVDIGFKQMYNGSAYGKTQLRGIGLLNKTVSYK